MIGIILLSIFGIYLILKCSCAMDNHEFVKTRRKVYCKKCGASFKINRMKR